MRLILTENIRPSSWGYKSTKMAPRLHCVLNVSEIVRLIEEEGADVNSRDVDGATALHVARSSAVARTLIEHGADVNSKNSRGMSPLHRARNFDVAKVLLENGACVNATDNFGNTALHRSNDMRTVRLLLQHSASIALRNEKGETAIHMSTYGSKVVALTRAGADVDSLDNTGKTLLMKKSKCIYVFSRLLLPLLSLHPSVFLKDMDGKTAIDFAINPAVKTLLLKYQVEQNWRRRKTLVLLREKAGHFVAKDDLMLRTTGLPTGVFREIARFL